MVSMLSIGYAATATAQQQPPQPQGQSLDMQDDRDEGMDMGWLGLLGLTGLFGLKRSADTRHRTTVGDHTASTVSR